MVGAMAAQAAGTSLPGDAHLAEPAREPELLHRHVVGEGLVIEQDLHLRHGEAVRERPTTPPCQPPRPPHSRAAAAAPGGGTGPSAGAGSAPARSTSRTSAARAERVRGVRVPPAPRDQRHHTGTPPAPLCPPRLGPHAPSRARSEGRGARSGQSPGARGPVNRQGSRRDPRSPAARPCSCPCWSCGGKRRGSLPAPGAQGGGGHRPDPQPLPWAPPARPGAAPLVTHTRSRGQRGGTGPARAGS